VEFILLTTEIPGQLSLAVLPWAGATSACATCDTFKMPKNRSYVLLS